MAALSPSSASLRGFDFSSRRLRPVYCPVCTTGFRQSVPSAHAVALSCGHALCAACSGPLRTGTPQPCPICQSPAVVVGESRGLSAYGEYFALNSSNSPGSPKPSCVACKADGALISATHHCECDVSCVMCKRHMDAHSRDAGHNSACSLTATLQPCVSTCAAHGSAPLTSFCLDDAVPCCSACVAGPHASHALKDIDAVCGYLSPSLRSSIEACGEGVGALEAARTKCADAKLCLDRATDAVCREFSAKVDAVIAALNTHREQVIGDAMRLAAERKDAISDKMRELETSLAQLRAGIALGEAAFSERRALVTLEARESLKTIQLLHRPVDASWFTPKVIEIACDPAVVTDSIPYMSEIRGSDTRSSSHSKLESIADLKRELTRWNTLALQLEPVLLSELQRLGAGTPGQLAGDAVHTLNAVALTGLSSPTVSLKFCQTLTAICSQSVANVPLSGEVCMGTVQAAMSAHILLSNICEAACAAFKTVCAGSPCNISRFLAVGGLGAVLQAMHVHATSLPVQLQACGALVAVSPCVDGAAALRSSPAHEHLVTIKRMRFVSAELDELVPRLLEKLQ